MKVILLRYGELSTKKANRGFFISTLKKNLERGLSSTSAKIVHDRGHMYIECSDDELEKVEDAINHTFGIQEYDICDVCLSTKEDIFNKVLELLKDKEFKSFKVETKRAWKEFPIKSPDFSRMLGSYILKNISGKKVDVHNPDLLVNVEIREGKSYIYFNSYKGLGGYPVGVQPRSFVMLSGGIDSPVAAYLAMKRGIKIDCVYFEALPHTSLNARQKVIDLTRKLSKYQGTINLHIIDFTKIQEEIYKTADNSYVITIMRRMMYRIMEELIKRNKGAAIINGESVGQVASQTLNSMKVINSVTNLPVIRPVACLDKLEIIDISKKIDTYDISILPYEDCCTVFVPKHPVINPEMDRAIEYENKFDYKKMIDDAVSHDYTISIKRDNEEFSDLL